MPAVNRRNHGSREREQRQAASCDNTPEISLLLADARLTVTNAMLVSKSFDCCQKVFRISNSTLMAFTGDIRPPAELMGMMPALYQHLGKEGYDSAFSIQTLVLKHTLQAQRVADAFRLKNGDVPSVEFVFTGRAKPNVPIFQTFRFKLPTLEFELLTQHGITVLGSGKSFFKPVAKWLEDSLESLRQEAADEQDAAHNLAWYIASFVQSSLQSLAMIGAEKGEPPDSSFGVILHGMYVDKSYVCPVESGPTGFRHYDGTACKSPFAAGFEVKYKHGRFFLHIKNGESTVLVTPNEYLKHKHLITPDAKPLDPHPKR